MEYVGKGTSRSGPWNRISASCAVQRIGAVVARGGRGLIAENRALVFAKLTLEGELLSSTRLPA